MSILLIAQLSFTDKARYRKYQGEFPAIFARFNGRVLVNDESPVVLEGSWNGDKVVVLEFPSVEEAQRFSSDPDYLRISEDRKAGASGIVLAVKSHS